MGFIVIYVSHVLALACEPIDPKLIPGLDKLYLREH